MTAACIVAPMPPIVKNLLLSKKFVVALLTGLGSVAAYFGWNVDPTKILTVATPFLVYIGAQGWADIGKEKVKAEGEIALKMRKLTLEREQMVDKEKLSAVPRPVEAGFAKLGALLFVSMFGLIALFACAHPGQVVLRTGQCVLDGKVMSTVISNLEKPAYAQLIADLAIAPDLVNCALQAVASQEVPGQGSGSGLPKGTPNLLAARAREVLAFRSAQ